MQRLIVAQINQDAGITPPPNDPAGDVHYNPNPNTQGGAPWFDWGPYLWARPNMQSPGNHLYWCNGESGTPCNGAKDFRHGDPDSGFRTYWGDYTHPTNTAQFRVAQQLLYWITGQSSVLGPQAFITDWITPWIKH